jgi:crotonobetaine/carnitine-CoA ligase
MPNIKLHLLKGAIIALADEYKRGDLGASLKAMRKAGRPAFANEFSHAGLLEDRARELGKKTMLYFKGQTFSYAEMNENANRMANFLKGLGGEPGKVVAIVMKNSPQWLDIFFGAQKLGMCAVPTNIQLRGEGLAYIFNHSEADFIALDPDLYQYYEAVKDKLEHKHKLIINTEGAQKAESLPAGAVSLESAYAPDSSTRKPEVAIDPESICMMLYTSGTTGRAKGVPTKYGRTMLKTMVVLAKATLKKSDIYYTCLPLFHANSLILTVSMAMAAKAQAAVYEKFSASRFWDEIRECGATVFNSIGAMIPILMKQPEKPDDADHNVRYVLSAACPTAMWEPFEKRFGTNIYEGYGSVDGGGFIIINFGNAPVGSMGKPLFGKYRLVDDEGNDVPVGTPGELIFFAGREKDRSVEYYKDDKATESKMKEGWLHTGDLVNSDKKGNLYFAGRKTESLRRKGENISAYEVEQAILQHPEIVECAVFAVPSELAEDEVMAVIVPLEDKKPEPSEIVRFLHDKLAKFAIPRYWRTMKEMPKTETQRVIKGILEKEGVTPDTVDTDTRAQNK